jgi:putative transposase
VVNTLTEEVFSQEFNCYGYRLCTEELKALGNIINQNKMYRLMKVFGLLLEKVGIGKIKRQ